MTGIYDNAGTIEAGAGTQRDPLPEGFYPQLMIEENSSFESTKKSGTWYYKANLEVLVEANGAEVGTGGTFMTQVAGNQHKSHDVRGIGQVKAYLGAAFGIADRFKQTQAIGTAEIKASYMNGGVSLAGHVVSAKVTHKEWKGDILCEFEFSPCLNAAGTGPLVVDPVTKRPIDGSALPAAAAPAPTPAAAAPQPAPAPAPAPAPVPAPSKAPPGFLPHPDAQYAALGWYYHPADPANPKQFL